jgi:L-threonylcarbamoyladenylate synthase
MPHSNDIETAAELLRGGGLVAFPTETVYGLGANALDADAVRRIFEAKGRPATNPIIVHVADSKSADAIAVVDDISRRLMDAFWPGPLTLVLNKRPIVPDIVTAGGPTVAVRMPRHPLALALIKAAGVPIAAPSANRSEQLSPTRAEHVARGLGDAVDMILDGGPCDVGLESTVLDVTLDPPRILRPGAVTSSMIVERVGIIVEASVVPGGNLVADAAVARSPGRMPRHYAPRTPLLIVEDVWGEAAARRGRAAVLAISSPAIPPSELAGLVRLPGDPTGYASGLYAVMHDLDDLGADVILVEQVPEIDAWAAIRDRLARAAR